MIQIKTLRVKAIQMLIHWNENLLFYPRLKAFYKQALNKDKFLLVDVGVNKGQTIDFFLKIWPKARVIGFEPNSRLFGFLREKYKSNKSIQLFQYGISSKKGKLIFNENVMDETSTFETVNHTSVYLKKKAKILGFQEVDELVVNRYEVEVISLADFIEVQNIREIDVLKIDTEGHEFSCLEGLFQKKLDCKIKYIQLESHNDDMYHRKTEHEIEALLQQNNFVLDTRVRHGFGGIDELIYKHI